MPLLICGGICVRSEKAGRNSVLHESQMPGLDAVWEYKGGNKYVPRRGNVKVRKYLRSVCFLLEHAPGESGRHFATASTSTSILPLGPGLRQKSSKVLGSEQSPKNLFGYLSSVLSAAYVPKILSWDGPRLWTKHRRNRAT